MIATRPKPVTGGDVRIMPEFVRGMECDVYYDFASGERPCDSDPIGTGPAAEIVEVRRLDGVDILAALSAAEVAELCRACVQDAVAQDRRAARMF